MNALVTLERPMVVEDRIARLELDVAEIKTDVKSLNARLGESIAANAKEFGSLRTEIEKGLGSLRVEMQKESGSLREEMQKEAGKQRADMQTLRAEMQTEYGNLRAEMQIESGKLRADMQIESGRLRADMEKGFGEMRTSLESAKLWMLVTGVGSVILLTFATFLGRALKLLP